MTPIVVGSQLRGFTIDRELARTQASVVVRATELATGQQVALKVAEASGASVRRRLATEALLQAELVVPGVVPVLDHFDHQGAFVLVLAYVRGGSLAALSQRYRPSPGETHAVLAAVLRGLRQIHGRGVVHRDLKPANVLLGIEQGQVIPQLADFGVAIRLGTVSPRSAERVGTPAYCAPEQHEDPSGVGVAADLFALGVVAFELLTGRVPFEGGSREALRAAKRHGEADLDVLPAPWRAWVGSLLAPDPGDRPVSADAALQALADVGVSAAVLQASEPLGRAVEALAARREWLASVDTEEPERPSGALVGRLAELGALRAELRAHRLVVVQGPPGVGKTHLAEQLAQGERWPGGVWRCASGGLASAPAVVAGIAAALGVAGPSASLQRRVGNVFRFQRDSLVILDGIEQLSPELLAPVSGWLQGSAHVSFLITARRVVGDVADACVLPLAPMSATDGHALFLACCPRAASSPEAVDALVAAVDGIPLAIELVAARARTVALDTLVRLVREHLFDVAAEEAGPRRTLRGAIAWSWGQLEPGQVWVLEQLAVFRGGFTAAAAQAVVRTTEGGPVQGLAHVLESLARDGLIRIVGSRLSVLAPIREFAEGRMGEATGAARLRHAVHYGSMGEADALRGADSVALRSGLALELDNLIAAGWTAVRTHEPTLVVRVLCALWEVVSVRGPADVVLDLVEASEVSGAPDVERVRFARVASLVQKLHGRLDVCQTLLQDALPLARALPDPHWLGVILHALGTLAVRRGDPQAALRRFEEAKEAYALADSQREWASVVHNEAVMALGRGDPAAALALMDAHAHVGHDVAHFTAPQLVNRGVALFELDRLEEALVALRAASLLATTDADERTLCYALSTLAGTLNELGRSEAAGVAQQAVRVARRVGDLEVQGLALGNLAMTQLVSGRAPAALDTLRSGLRVLEAASSPWYDAVLRGQLGRMLLDDHQLAEAREELIASDQVLTALPDPLHGSQVKAHLALLEAREGALIRARELLQQARAQLQRPSARRVATLDLVDAEITWLQGDTEEARRLLSAASHQVRSPTTVLGQAVAALAARL
ncbi:MAG: protein kinase [Myxococcales bacterium]|nr:protein kinase [Myxococcales bacterium]